VLSDIRVLQKELKKTENECRILKWAIKSTRVVSPSVQLISMTDNRGKHGLDRMFLSHNSAGALISP